MLSYLVMQNIPYQFSMAHLPSCKLKLVLHNLKGESWTVNSVPTTRVHTSHTLCGGWMAFVRGNDINMGDICVFELVQDCELRVHIFRVGKEISEDQSGKGTLNRLGAGHAVIPRKTLKGLPKKMNGNSLKVHSKRSKRIEMPDKKSSKPWQEPFCSDARKHSSAKKVSTKVMVCSQPKKPSKRLGKVTPQHHHVICVLKVCKKVFSMVSFYVMMPTICCFKNGVYYFSIYVCSLIVVY